ncbi:MAG: caspase family protein [Phycisphaerae bacterium]|nr:caspase family protein [Phycisphaerae bacterium]
MVSEAPTVVVEVGLREFFIEWSVEWSAAQLFAVQRRVAASIIFEYTVRSGNGPLLVRNVEEVNSESTNEDFNSRRRLERLLSDRLSRAVDKALDDPEFLAAMAKARDSQATAVAKAKENVKVESLLEPPPERPSSPVVWTPDSRHCLWVLAVGVGQYKDPQVPPLPFARGDAEQVRDWFMKLDVKGMTRDSVHVLLDEQATRENLLTQIDWLRKQALPEDAVFIYFAGHGAPELASDGTSVDAKYLVLYDTSPDTLFSTGFPLDDLMRKLDTVKAKTQVLILEACYAGPVGQEILKKTPTADLEIRPRSIQMLGEKGGRVILSASSGRQMAIASEEIKGGLFTHYLLNAWADGSQQLLSERFEEARDQVRRASNRIGSYQEPAKFGDQNVDVILKLK